MNTYRKTSIIVGVLFIVGTLAGIVSAALINPAYYALHNFIQVAANETQIIIGALLVWLMGFSLALISLFMYPIFKKQHEVLAIGYVVFRGAIETVTYIAIGVCMLLPLYLSQHYTNGGILNLTNFQNIGIIILKTREIISVSIIFVFSVGGLIFYLLLFQSKLIPRWLSVWGLLAIVLHLATGLLMLFGLQTETSTLNTIMNFPIFLQEMVMAVWLIVKGFNKNNCVTIN